jgi:dTDP-4-dehydrorhamnose reductase
VILLFGASGQLGQELRGERRRSDAACRACRTRSRHRGCAAVRAAIARHEPALVVNARPTPRSISRKARPEAARLATKSALGCSAPPARPPAFRLIHISTDYVFDGSKAGAYVETDPVAPINVYGRRQKPASARARRDSAPCDPAHRGSTASSATTSSRPMLGLRDAR